MQLQPEVIEVSLLEQVHSFSRQFLAGDEMQVEMASWNAGWRREALEFYLPLGWSLAITNDTEIRGYFIAQPLLFLNANTQTLWIEELLSDSDEVTECLVQTAIGLSREKHLQRVILPKTELIQRYVPKDKTVDFGQNRIEVTTVKK